MKIAVVSLGCPKNQVDADVFCRSLIEAGHVTVPNIEFADAIIINTCGFIQSAKEEAIENILQACEIKNRNPNAKVIVTGCLAERYNEEIANEMPEVDAVVGIGCNKNLVKIIDEFAKESGKKSTVKAFGKKTDLQLGGKRIISTPKHYAWLKIAEGCSNACSYCAIPLIRGPLRSRELKDCVNEAKWLVQQGVKELVLVAQDVTAFGDDRGKNEIVSLLLQLDEIDGLHWIRILYAYPEKITAELLDAMAESKKIVPYLDLPIQHINEDVLTSMRRKGGSDAVKNAICLIREKLPNATLRTTLIVGYPSESLQQFEELQNFVLQTKFDRLGCFAYSEEDGTSAAKMSGQIPIEERTRRADCIMQLQANIMAKKQQSKIGEVVEVVCDDYDDEMNCWLCRTACDAPEIDVNVFVRSDEELQIGEFYFVKIANAEVYDLWADKI